MEMEYVVIGSDGIVKTKVTTPWTRALHKRNRVAKGHIWLDGSPYAVDPRRFLRYVYRKKRYLWLIPQMGFLQMWHEGEPEPIDFFNRESIKEDRIAQMVFAEAARSTRLRRLLHPSTDWTVVALIFMAIALVVMGFALYTAR